MNRERDEIEIDLREIFAVLKKRIIIIALTAIVFAGVAGIYSFFMAQPIYDSTAKLYITTQSTSLTTLADIQAGTSLTQDYMELIKSRPVVEEVIQKTGVNMEYEEVLPLITVSNPTDTRILNINIQNKDPYQATQIANTFAEVAKKQISEIMKTDEPSIVETAHQAEEPIKPEKGKNIAIAFLLGAFLAALISIVIYILDDTIKTQDDVEQYLGLNVLATVPLKAGEKKQKRHLLNKKERR